jgi:hypothetical protein
MIRELDAYAPGDMIREFRSVWSLRSNLNIIPIHYCNGDHSDTCSRNRRDCMEFECGGCG